MVEGALLFLICSAAIFAVNALRTDDQRRLIKSHLEAMGAVDIEIVHRLFSYDEKGSRVYEIEYTDSSGIRLQATCKTLAQRPARIDLTV